MKSILLAIPLALGATATPGWANSDHVVNFGYQSHELVTEQGREALLKRMKATSRAACVGTSSVFYWHWTNHDCQVDLEKQFVRAIDNSVLIAQYEGKTAKIAHSGS